MRNTKKRQQLAEIAAQSVQRRKFLKDVKQLKEDGVGEREIAARYSLSVSKLRTAIAIAKEQEYAS